MAEVLDWQRAVNSHQVVQHVAQVLTRGGLVALPTETVYGIAASALLPDAVDRLVEIKGRADDKPLTLAIGGAEEVLDWVPGLSQVGRRLAGRCWPGPVTLVCADGVTEGRACWLPERVRRRVCPKGSLGLRVPAHGAILQLLPLLGGPLVLTSANRSGAAEATCADAVLHAVGERLDLVVDDGPSRYGQASTVVEITGNSWNVLREGVVSAQLLETLSGCMIVFVCTGNTCRSPIAEALCKKLLAERLECLPEELPARGFVVRSAGLAAMMGGRAAPEAVAAVRELGADLTGHASRPMTAELASQADLLIAMTHGHVAALSELFPALAAQPRVLSADGMDIPDPIGADQQTYRVCARQILSCLETLVPEVQPR
jgi:protein-tyrosine phosphatase